MRKWIRVDGTKKGSPTGVYRDVSDVEGGERGVNGRGVRRQKRHAARGCRGQEEPGGQVEGNKTASVGWEMEAGRIEAFFSGGPRL